MNQDIHSRMLELLKEQKELEKILARNPLNAVANAKWKLNEKKIRALKNATQNP